MFDRARPFLARIAVPRLSVSIFIWTVYLRIVFKVVCDTSCSKAKSMSCRHRKPSSICRCVLDDISLMFSAAILNVWNIIGIVRVEGTRTATLIESVRFCSAFYYASFLLIRAFPCPSSVFCCVLGLVGGVHLCFPITGGSNISLPLSGTFSLRVCIQGSHSLSGSLNVKCCHFRLHGYHFFGDSTGCDVGRGRPRPAATDHAFVGDWGPAVPHQYLAGCLWSSNRRQKGNIPMLGHTVLSGGSPRFDCHHCRVGFVRL